MKIRKFYINAINARIVYNQYGDHDKNGKMYVLKKYEKKIRRKIRKIH